MRRNLAISLMASLGIAAAACGCASRQPAAPQVPRTADGYEARQAAALVYPLGTLHPDDARELESALARSDRGQYAVLGYDLPTVTYSTVVVDDRQQTLDFGWRSGGVQIDDYQRRATSVRSSVRYR